MKEIRNWKIRGIFFGIAVFMAGVLASSNSHALIACAKNVVTENWYCHDSSSTAPNVGGGTTSHGSGSHCWCYAGGGWMFSGHSFYSGASYCSFGCPDECGA
jgi:hypothetical protein